MKQFWPVAISVGLLPVGVSAQEAEPGGVFFRFAVEQRFETSDDFDLATEEAESGFEAVTGLNFGAVTETRTQRLSFDVDTDVRVSDGETVVDDTSLTLAYTRESADAMLDVAVSTTRSDIAFLRDVGDFLDDEGVLVLPDDIDDLTGTGIRSTTVVEAGLEWGLTAPVGYVLGLRWEGERYDEASPDLIETDTAVFSAGTRLTLNEVTTGTLTLSYTQTEDEGADPEETAALTGAITLERPRGALTGRITGARDEEGETFWLAAIDRTFEVPNGTFDGTIGVTEDEFGDLRALAELDYLMPLPAGEIGLSFSSLVEAGGTDRDTVLQAAYLQELNDVSELRFALDVGQVESYEDGSTLATGGLSAAYAIELTPVWDLNVGARRDVREEDGEVSQATTVFLALDRVFSWRP